MLYALCETAHAVAAPFSMAARLTRALWDSPLNPVAGTSIGRRAFATADLAANLTRRYGRPPWNIDTITTVDGEAAVTQSVVWRNPWVALRRFSRERPAVAPGGLRAPVLLVAPVSGHYATLLRGTARAFLRDRDIYVTDWANARDVPLFEGRFDFHDYVDVVRRMLTAIGEPAHVVAVCQPGPPVLAAAALMAEEGDALRPASLAFLGSPIDARRAPTVTNRLAEARPFAWFESRMIHSVPPPYLGAFRRVYPGFVQLYSFLSMNAEKHEQAHWRYFADLVRGDGDSTDKHREFYDEYLSVLDLTEEFYLQTVDIVFQRHLLAKGELVHRGRRVDCAALADIGLMTIEGERDDISGVGQTQAAHGLCPNIPEVLRALWVQPGVGHYGVFNGRRFDEEIYPRILAFHARVEQTALVANRLSGAARATSLSQDAAVPSRRAA